MDPLGLEMCFLFLTLNSSAALHWDSAPQHQHAAPPVQRPLRGPPQEHRRPQHPRPPPLAGQWGGQRQWRQHRRQAGQEEQELRIQVLQQAERGASVRREGRERGESERKEKWWKVRDERKEKGGKAWGDLLLLGDACKGASLRIVTNWRCVSSELCNTECKSQAFYSAIANVC